MAAQADSLWTPECPPTVPETDATSRMWFDMSGFDFLHPDPYLFRDLVQDVMDDPATFDNVVRNLTISPLGFLIWHNGMHPDATPDDDTQPEQFNIYDLNGYGSEDPHTHGRTSETVTFFPPGHRQVVHRYTPLPRGYQVSSDVPAKEYDIVANHLVENAKGGRPFYFFTKLGKISLLLNSSTLKSGMSGERFFPWEIHSVDVQPVGRTSSSGLRRGVSFQRKTDLQPVEDFTTVEGLMGIKHLTQDEANLVLEERAALEEKITRGDIENARRLGATSIIYAPIGRPFEEMQPQPQAPRIIDYWEEADDDTRFVNGISRAAATGLIEGMLLTAEDLVKVADATRNRHY